MDKKLFKGDTKMKIKIAGIEMDYKDETYNKFEVAYYSGNRYILKYRTIYALHYSLNAGGLYAIKIYYKQTGLPLTKRGCFIFANNAAVNTILGYEFLNKSEVK